MKKDHLGNPLTPGDFVVYACGGSGSGAYLSSGYVIGFTPKNVRIGDTPDINQIGRLKHKSKVSRAVKPE